MFPTLQIGPLALPVPGLVILIGIWLALSLIERRAVRNGISSNIIYNLVIISVCVGVITARLAYVIQYPSAFQASPISIISINPRLFDLSAGLIFGLLAGIVVAKRNQLKLWPTLDMMAPGLALFVVFLGVSHLASGVAFGEPTQMPWGLYLWGEQRHPSQVYEIILACLVLVAVLLLEKRAHSWPAGILFWAFIGMSAASRLLVEAFRGDSTLIPGGFRLEQVIAWLVLAVSLFAIYQRIYSHDKENQTFDLS